MAGYVWSLNGVPWNENIPPLPVAVGERVELIFVNKTPMPHPMHLHGHEFQVVEIDGKRFPGAVRDTVLVPRGRRVVVAFDANNPGYWALHCHLLYHLEAGMLTTFASQSAGALAADGVAHSTAAAAPTPWSAGSAMTSTSSTMRAMWCSRTHAKAPTRCSPRSAMPCRRT